MCHQSGQRGRGHGSRYSSGLPKSPSTTEIIASSTRSSARVVDKCHHIIEKMDARSALQAKLTKAFEDGDYELYGTLQEQLENLPAEPDPSQAPVEEEPQTFEAKLRAVSSMLDKSLAIGRETMQVNRDHGHAIPAALLSRMIETKKWQKKIDETLTTRKGPLFEHFTNSTRQVNACV